MHEKEYKKIIARLLKNRETGKWNKEICIWHGQEIQLRDEKN